MPAQNAIRISVDLNQPEKGTIVAAKLNVIDYFLIGG
jgi:hypothetical protein